MEDEEIEQNKPGGSGSANTNAIYWSTPNMSI